MDPKMVKLALNVVKLGADKIPDKLFDAIPGGYYKAKEQAKAIEKAEKKQRRRRRERRRRSSYSDADTDGMETDDSGYWDERSERRRHRSHEDHDRPQRRNKYPSPFAPYGRAEGGDGPVGTKNEYYSGQPLHENQSSQAQYPHGRYAPAPGAHDGVNAAAANNYQRRQINGQYGSPQDSPRSSVRSYDDDYDSATSYSQSSVRSRNSRRGRRGRSMSRGRNRSKSRIRGALKETLDPDSGALFPGAVGALAGGLLAKEVGRGPLATLAGAVLGGVGGSAWGKRHHKKEHLDKEDFGSRARSMKDRSRSRRRHDRYDGYDSY